MNFLKTQKPICLLILLSFLTFACKDEKPKTKPGDYFSNSQKEALLSEIVLKTAKLPESVGAKSEIEAYYQSQNKAYQWHFAHEKNGNVFFFVSRPAPSLYGKRTGIGGFLKTSNHITISGFKEVFHTFKMKPAVLLSKGATLFEKMVNGEDLSSFYPNANQKEEWIEFPDQLNYYDSTSQSWKIKGF